MHNWHGTYLTNERLTGTPISSRLSNYAWWYVGGVNLDSSYHQFKYKGNVV